MVDRAKIVVVGAGWWATQHHIPGLMGYPSAELVAVVDPDQGKLDAVRRHFGLEATFTDLDQAVTASMAQGAVLAVPHALHYPLAKSALEMGLHVMVEKPMTLHAREAWELVELAQSRQLQLTVGYPWNYTRHANLARELITSGRLGEVQLVNGLFASMVIEYLRGNPEAYRSVFKFPVTGPGSRTYSDPALAGGGQGHLQITHLAGLLLWVSGLEPASVFARMNNLDCSVDVIDALSVSFSNGAIGTIASTGNIAPGHGEEHEIRIYLERGSVTLQPILGRMRVRYADGAEEEVPELGPDERYPAEATARNLVDLMLGGPTTCGPGELGARVVSLLDAAYASARSGAAELAGLARAEGRTGVFSDLR